jgi:RHS repeat-associated protein
MGTASFDLDYRLTRTQAAGSSAVQDLTLGYDGADNISSVADAVSPNLSQTFQYDLLGRVTQGVGPYGTDNYTYDAVGNRLTRSLVNGGTTTSTTYTIASSNNQLASTASGGVTLSYTYDANGARTAIKKGNQTQASYTYNNDARLATAGTATLKYNAFGQRSVETITGGGTHFIFDQSGNLLGEHGTAGSLLRNYIYLNGNPFALVDGAGNVSYVLNDHIGQPQKMVNASGAVTWHRVSGVYGDTVSQPVGTTAANPQRFPGQQYDANLGFAYNYFRDYDQTTGRYLEADPVGLKGGPNLYAYVSANPIGKADPWGLRPVDVYIWNYEGSKSSLGHVLITEHNNPGKIIVNQWPSQPVDSITDSRVPQIQPPPTYQDAVRSEGGPADARYAVEVPNDAGLDKAARNQRNRRYWDTFPSGNPDETNCTYAAWSVLKAGGVELGSHPLTPKALQDQLSQLIRNRNGSIGPNRAFTPQPVIFIP